MSDQAREQTLSMSFVEALVREMGLSSAALRHFMRELQIAGDQDAAPLPGLSAAQFTLLYRHLVSLSDDEMPGLFPRPFRSGALRLTCMTLLEGDTLSKALRRWSHLLRQLQDNFVLDIQQADGRCHLSILPTNEEQVLKPLATDLFIKLVHGMACWLTGKTLPLRHVALRTSRVHVCGELMNWFPGPLRFDQTYSALALDDSWMEQAVVRGKPDLEAFMAAAPGNWITCRFDDERLHERVRRYLESVLPASATAESAAAALHLSTRSLHRRLHQEQTTFQRIKDELRRDLAMHKLTRGAQPIAAIAFELGFDSITSFHRAFKGWTGATPGVYRLQRQHVRGQAQPGEEAASSRLE